MPREQKVGFTILIMIVGFAGAFCFRRQPEEEVALPALQDESELNQLIAEYRLRPFLPGIDTEDTLESHQQLEEYLAMSRKAKELTSPNEKEVPAPIHSVESSADAQRQNQQLKRPRGQGADIRTVPANFENKRLSDQTRIHIVQPGDTLSGIAQKYLGSASRFLEIYEANRQKLSGPDQLKLNMKLIIPVDGAKQKKEIIKQARKPAAPDVSSGAKSDRTAGEKPEQAVRLKSAKTEHRAKKKLFVPMKHSPFSRTASQKQESRR